MKIFLITFILMLTFCKNNFAQGDCSSALQYCGNGVSFAMDTSGTDLGNINCLLTSPSPIWVYVEIDQPGDFNFQISGTDLAGSSSLDIDLVVFGPYASLDCMNITDSINDNPIVFCNYTTVTDYNFSILGAQSGEIYIFIVTNFSNVPGLANLVMPSYSGTLVQNNCSTNIIDPITNDIDFTVQNPLTDLLLLSNFSGSCTFSIYDITGRKIFYQENVTNNFSTNLNFVDSGLLILELENENGQKTIKKVIKY